MVFSKTSPRFYMCPRALELFADTNVRDSHSHSNDEQVNLQSSRDENGEDIYGLLVQMIDDAIEDVRASQPTVKPLVEGDVVSRSVKYNRKRDLNEWHTNRDEARTWLLDEQDQEGRRVFSFEWCCIALGWDSLKIRERLRELLAEVPTPRTVEAA
jgi:hypothetical protein